MKVIVGMSGGVDSSVTAALLKQQGHEVIGAFMKNWTDTKDVSGICDWRNDLRDARRVAAKLGIQLMVMDFQEEYRKGVVDYMFAEYSVGRTPNPDVICNNLIKFGSFLETAKKLGADKIATGHYARISPRHPEHSAVPAGRQEGSRKVYHLLQAKDKNKDQTYFLHRLNQDQLSMTLFPLGDYIKNEVRVMAREFELPTAERKESMGICFIGDIDVKEFLKQKIKPQPGQVVTTAGETVGEHEGLAYYTIGQRHGFGGRGGTDPLYVVSKDFEKNVLLVGPENDPALYTQEIKVGDIHWITGKPALPLECEVRFRHRQELQKATIASESKRLLVKTKESQRAIAPGQFAVFYKNGECLGGGVIQ